MNTDELVNLILETLRQVQKMSGRSIDNIDVEISPIGGLEGFDSLSGVEVTMMLADRMKCEIRGDVNLFVSEDGRRASTVREIAERIKTLLPEKKE